MSPPPGPGGSSQVFISGFYLCNLSGLLHGTYRNACRTRGEHSQSRCFFLGPLTSCVVALHTALLMADPVMLCCAAAMRSVIDWPDMAPLDRHGQ